MQVTRRSYRDTAFSTPLLGFGTMRFPNTEGKVDIVATEAMIDQAMAAGCNYFDTAYMYHGGESEKILGKILKKYPRESYILTTKIPIASLKSPEEQEAVFQEQLDRTQAGYFDFYFIHWLCDAHWKKAQEFKTLEFILKKQAEGKVRKIGFSYHGEPEVLEAIAKAFPWDLVQIQLNYLDWELLRAREQYEVLTKQNIPVAIMEPLKGGSLVQLTEEARRVFKEADPEVSMASWGLRFAASLPNVQVVLSGMSSMEQVEDNIRTFSPMKPFTEKDYAVIDQAMEAYRKSVSIPCTACKYCSPCPAGVDIPHNLAAFNLLKVGLNRFQAKLAYTALAENQRASACIGCGVCKEKCPQRINIPEYMKEIAETFRDK